MLLLGLFYFWIEDRLNVHASTLAFSFGTLSKCLVLDSGKAIGHTQRKQTRPNIALR